MKELDNLVKKYESIFLEKLNISTWTHEYCEKLLNEIRSKKNKILTESYYVDIINNKKYYQMLILEDICRIMLTEIRPKRIKRKKGALKNVQQ